MAQGRGRSSGIVTGMLLIHTGLHTETAFTLGIQITRQVHGEEECVHLLADLSLLSQNCLQRRLQQVCGCMMSPCACSSAGVYFSSNLHSMHGSQARTQTFNCLQLACGLT